ncbi:MAG: hypothetical protein A2117_00060 [Candidatus Wildermuthbacteria bacterium GWA2_46_15]|uniref:Thymidylate kinase-like domain-containing protein n=1 Tax=Candidatus Wildermuthbacteria bacterium GWA2_46_15 TaxID=1802443 RepID=A0A1G2QNA3_9BACT|nr:MAG: hypothetical protein A2117_00060 [Candidatus Wildermuthbacteria bacterium GWA2_46_15]
MDKMRGAWIGFCGIDGAGKSTQAALTCSWLTQKGLPNLLREGKRDFVSEMASAIARSHGAESGRKYFGEEYYMVALSFDLLREAVLDVRPFLAAGTTVVSARTAFCRLAGGLLRECRSLELAKEVAFFDGIPDIVIWLDASSEVACQRVIERGLDIATVEHLTVYRAAMGRILQGYSHIRIDGDEPVDSVKLEVRRTIEKALRL